MRWFWIDRFVEFECGRLAKAIKNISLAEEYLQDHFPGYPVMPATLIIEGAAQTGGLLVAQCSDFREKVVLAKVSSARFYAEAVPGDTLTYTATIEALQKDGASVQVLVHRGEELLAQLELMFAHLDGEFANKILFRPKTLLFWLRALGTFQVGRLPDGNPLPEPDWMRQAEATEAD
ncbi:MAG: beta-hydroxyacyl-ACP dehydratase [Thermoguttaceae bacterium]|nr:beta-hydroxyacyl-ACP dehydratase [Thermoguttaceae bacterium]MDW8036765.1 3-hydroxyacyl-ACP dehydratase FabZ family protein [Thermoguttaceae bacterium]